MPRQLIHGDLNHENIPIDSNLPRRGAPSVLRHFEDIAHLDQLLIRAAIRMLLIVSELKGVDGWARVQRKKPPRLSSTLA
ncbi:MAG: hypothetical protein GY832_38735 [Chloroflexi bacterium]|nr:hypothetical protein [Chloroflexota bacterium]